MPWLGMGASGSCAGDQDTAGLAPVGSPARQVAQTYLTCAPPPALHSTPGLVLVEQLDCATWEPRGSFVAMNVS